MGMRLEQHRAIADDFSPLAPQVARRAHLIETTAGSRQCFCLRQCTLAGRLSCSIDIDHQPMFSCPVKQTTRRRKWRTRKQILLKQLAECLYA